MSNRNLLLALLAAWLLGSLWWQHSKIMNCEKPNANQFMADSSKVESDTLAILPDSSIADTLIADTTLITPAAGTTDEDLAKSQKYSSLFKPMNLYFKVNDANYIKTVDNEKFVTEALTYLKANATKSLQITGHTDSDGDEAANLKLSEKRALQVKNKFIAKGFNADQLKTEAKGEISPIATNDTPEGKKANRRVEIVVNQ